MNIQKEKKESFNWLHLSDFHVGKDVYKQQKVFERILGEISKRIEQVERLDFVFITGDIANKGKLDEYQEFDDKFIIPLIDILGDSHLSRVFIIPGNHDVQRLEGRAVMKQGVLQAIPDFLDPTCEGLKLREPLLCRFENFTKFDWFLEADRWLDEEHGYLAKTIKIEGALIGILQLNTSWLCEGNSDHLQLTPGVEMVEDGLKSLGQCDKIVVLGHHPISWFIPSDGERINTLFSKHEVLYLHGHLHKTKQGTQIVADSSFMAIQAGCVFDTRNSEEWVTRIVWGRYSFIDNHVNLIPRKWKTNLTEWGDDSDHIPEHYKLENGEGWSIPTLYEPVKCRTPKAARYPEISKGWALVDGEFLSSRTKSVSDESILQYFEGRLPQWSDVLSGLVPVREIVGELQELIQTGTATSENQLVVLTGAGGEGKSTALLQVIHALAKLNEVQILWRYDNDSPLSIENIRMVSKSDKRWILVSDEGDSLIKDVENLFRYLREDSPVQVFLSCRDTDWIEKRGNDIDWTKICKFCMRGMSGLSQQDARLIVKAWTHYGDRGLGKLERLDEDDAVERLLEAAKDEASSSQGSFLGAMLRVRVGEALEDHVAELMNRLEKIQLRETSEKHTLLDAFMAISIPHSFNILNLSKTLLCEYFELNESKVKSAILKPLGEEAAAESVGDFVLTRHRAIAEAALRVGEQRFDYDPELILCDLVSSAIRASEQGLSVPNLGQWRFLSSKMYEEGNVSFAIKLAKAALRYDPNNSFLLVKLAQLYRESGQADQTVKIFRSAGLITDSNRGYFTEWAASEASIGNNAVNAYLNALSISDNVNAGFPKLRDIGFGLVGCCLSFIRLFEDFGLPVYAYGAVSADLVARSLSIDYKSIELLEANYTWLDQAQSRFTPTFKNVCQCIYNAVDASFVQREIDSDIRLPSPQDLKFGAFETLIDRTRIDFSVAKREPNFVRGNK